MKKPFSNLAILLLTSAFILNTSCSSGGGGGGTTSTAFSGTTTPAAIDDTNAEAIGTTAGEAIQQADASNGLSNSPFGISMTSSIDMDGLNALVLSTANNINTPAGLDVSDGLCSSGSATASDFGSATSGPVNFNITYTNCVITDGGGVSVNGKVVIHYNDISDPNSGFSIAYSNFTVNDPVDGTTTINTTITCSDAYNCTYNSDFVGSDGKTHRVSNFSISGGASAGFNGSATFYHSVYGEVSITVTNITYGGSCGSHPNGGSIAFSSGSTSGSINFNSDCSVSGTWNNGTTSGSFGTPVVT